MARQGGRLWRARARRALRARPDWVIFRRRWAAALRDCELARELRIEAAMSEPLETWIDAAIGETREALVRDGRPVALRVARWSDGGRRARWGEVYAARVTRIDRRRRGAF